MTLPPNFSPRIRARSAVHHSRFLGDGRWRDPVRSGLTSQHLDVADVRAPPRSAANLLARHSCIELFGNGWCREQEECKCGKIKKKINDQAHGKNLNFLLSNDVCQIIKNTVICGTCIIYDNIVHIPGTYRRSHCTTVSIAYRTTSGLR